MSCQSLMLRSFRSLSVCHPLNGQYMLMNNQFRAFGVSKQTRINRRLRKYRSDKIQKEQSYNSQEALKMFYSRKAQNASEAGEKDKSMEILNLSKELQQEEVFDKIKEISKERGFKESVDAIVKLNVDPTKGDQMIRGTCILPSGTGREIKVCVFADGEFHKELNEVGADYIGNDQTIADIANGIVPFDKIICTQEFISQLKRYARVLGPKGLMPNVKSGTLVKSDEIIERVKESKLGLIEFRINQEAFISTKIGLREFEDGNLNTNFDALMMALIKKKPESIKGRYFLKAMVKTSMGPPLKIDIGRYATIVAQQNAL